MFIEMKCKRTKFPTYVTGSSLADIVKIENTKISNSNDLALTLTGVQGEFDGRFWKPFPL